MASLTEHLTRTLCEMSELRKSFAPPANIYLVYIYINRVYLSIYLQCLTGFLPERQVINQFRKPKSEADPSEAMALANTAVREVLKISPREEQGGITR